MHVRRLLVTTAFLLVALQACDALPIPTSAPEQIQPTDPPALDDAAIIKAALSAETGIPVDRLEFTMDVNTGAHAKGSLGEVGAEERGIYIAAKVGDGWTIVYAGYSLPLCEDLELFVIPEAIATECLAQSAAGYPTILAALLARTGLPEAELSYVVDVNSGFHVKGRILPTETIQLANFLAAAVDGGWLVVFHGPAEPLCTEITPYNFPLDIAPNCIDSDGTLLDRAAADRPHIEAALVAATGMTAEELYFTIGTNTGAHAFGNLTGGYYLAAKTGGSWAIAFYGEATPFCSDVDPYFFPSSMVPACTGDDLSQVDRTAYDTQGIEDALVAFTGITADQLDISIEINTGAHVSGTYDQIGISTGTHFLAAKVNGEWVVVFEGEQPSCAEIENYYFPEEVVPGCLEDGSAPS